MSRLIDVDDDGGGGSVVETVLLVDVDDVEGLVVCVLDVETAVVAVVGGTTTVATVVGAIAGAVVAERVAVVVSSGKSDGRPGRIGSLA